MSMNKTVVVSGVNVTEMGPLTVFIEALQCLSRRRDKLSKIYALVHRKELFPEIAGINFIEFPGMKQYWHRRLYREYVQFMDFSKELNPFLWLSMNDITPNVVAKRRAVYCHNPSPFYDLPWREAILSPKFALFNCFYEQLYRLNITRNDYVIVQQEWLRQEFKNRFGLKNNVIVAHPVISEVQSATSEITRERTEEVRFFYPCFPRVFKNVETVLEAAERLEERCNYRFRIDLTLDGSENAYARSIVDRFQQLKTVKYLGRMSHGDVLQKYLETDCLIFASKLETWGLPISEFKPLGKPMLIANLPYALETLGYYEKAAFFPATDSAELADKMADMISGRLAFAPPKEQSISEPFAGNWDDLFSILLEDTETQPHAFRENSHFTGTSGNRLPIRSKRFQQPTDSV